MSCCGNCGYDKELETKRVFLLIDALNEVKASLDQVRGEAFNGPLIEAIKKIRDTIYTYDHKGPWREDWVTWVKVNTRGWYDDDHLWGSHYCFPTVQELTAFQNIVRNSKERP